MVFFLEEDYLVRHDAFARSIDFWSSYEPCFLVPYDFPDRYSSTDDQDYDQVAILRMPHMHWRSVESSKVTFAVRLDFFLKFRASLPAPWNYRKRARSLRTYGIWSPIP